MGSRNDRTPRIVVDTNLVLSALVFGGGTPSALRLAWQEGRCHPLVSRDTVSELLRVLAYPKFRLGPTERDQLLGDYLPYCTTIQVPRQMTGLPLCRDPYDQPFLALAAAGRADHLVSGDSDLLDLADSVPFGIVTAVDLLTRLPGTASDHPK